MLRFIAATSVALYALLVLGSVGLLFLGGDQYWAGTLLLYGPRWLLALPLLLVVPLSLIRMKLFVVTLASAIVLSVCGLGLRIPLRAHDEKGASLKLATFNLGAAKRLKDFDEFAKETSLDIVLLQECGSEIRLRSFPHWDYKPGLCLGSRFPVASADVIPKELLRSDATAAHYEIKPPEKPSLCVIGVHMETPREGIEAVLENKGKGIPELEKSTRMRAEEATTVGRWARSFGTHCIVAGDFNLTVESRVYRAAWGDFDNAFDRAGFGFGYTKWTRHYGARIDHVLYSKPFYAENAEVAPDFGSDHRPLLVSLATK